MKLRTYVAAAAGWARNIAPSVTCDVSGLAGCGLIVFGVWKIYEPAGFIVTGFMLLLGAWFGARRG